MTRDRSGSAARTGGVQASRRKAGPCDQLGPRPCAAILPECEGVHPQGDKVRGECLSRGAPAARVGRGRGPAAAPCAVEYFLRIRPKPSGASVCVRRVALRKFADRAAQLSRGVWGRGEFFWCTPFDRRSPDGQGSVVNASIAPGHPAAKSSLNFPIVVEWTECGAILSGLGQHQHVRSLWVDTSWDVCEARVGGGSFPLPEPHIHKR